MPLKTERPSFASLLWAVLFVFVGVVTILVGLKYLQEWNAVQAGLAACAVTWVVAGTVMLVSGPWALLTAGRKSAPLRVGNWAMMATGAVIVVGVLSHAVPCGGVT